MTSSDFQDPPTGRRAEARRRRQQRRRRLLVTAAVAGVAVLLAFTAYLISSGDEVSRTPSAQVRTQSTLLLQLQAGNGAAISSSLLAHDPGAGDDEDPGSGSVVLMPPQLLVNVAGSGQTRLDRAVRTVPPETVRNAVSDLLGVTIDGGWVLDLASFGRLVDQVGGVAVDADVPVLGGPGGRSVVIAEGSQKLDGARATLFLTYLADGEEEQARLARVQQVLDGVIRALPRSVAEVRQVLSTLGDRSVSSLALPQLAELLVGLASDERDDDLQYDVLPAVTIDTGGTETTYRIDEQPAQALVDRLLAASVPEAARQGDNRVLVLNGVGTPNIGEKVRAKLVPAGFVFVGSRNAPSFSYPKTLVLVPGATTEAQALGERVAKAIGVPATAVATSPIGSVADVIVVVGADFRP